ncbi:hypothetical protein Tco_0644673 [Tanacetum coccineum]
MLTKRYSSVTGMLQIQVYNGLDPTKESNSLIYVHGNLTTDTEYKEKKLLSVGGEFALGNMTGNKLISYLNIKILKVVLFPFEMVKVLISRKAMRVFNKRTRIVEETLNIRFLENAPNVIGNEPDWLFDVDSLSKSMNYIPVIVVGNQTNGIAGKRDNIVAGPKVSKKDCWYEATKVNEKWELLRKVWCTRDYQLTHPIETNKALVKDKEVEAVDVHLYRSMIGSLMYLTASRPDIIFVVCACASDMLELALTGYSTTGGCQFLGRRLISWQCKKQTIVSNSTTEAEYVAAANYCGQVLWIQNQMLDYGFNFMNTKIYIDNESTICIVKNPVFHFKNQDIEILGTFSIRDCYEKKFIQLRLSFMAVETEWKWLPTTTSSLEAQSSGPRCQDTILGVQKLKVGLRLRLNSPIIHLSQELTHFEVERTFWATAKVKMVNGERQLQSLVDKKKVIITKTSIRSDLKLEDAGGTDCLPTATIFEELARMGKDSAPTDPTAEETPNKAHVSTPSYDPSQSGEDRMQLHELMNLYTKLSDRVLATETKKSNQALEIESLKRRVKSLEKRKKRMYPNRGLDTGVLEEQEKDVAEKEVSAADPVTTAGEEVTTGNVDVTTVNAPTTTIDELTLA